MPTTNADKVTVRAPPFLLHATGLAKKSSKPLMEKEPVYVLKAVAAIMRSLAARNSVVTQG